MSYFSQRRDRLRRMLKTSGADAVLVTNPVNVTYLTGFQGDSTYLVMNRTDGVLLTDTRYEEQIAEEAGDLPAEIRDSSMTMNSLVTRIASRMKLSSIAVDSVSLSYQAYQALDAALEKVTLVATEGWVESLREIKDRMELEAITHSISLAERSFAVIRASLRADQTEREIAHNLEHRIRLFGGTECAFEPIVGVGPRAALPHGIPSERTIAESPFVLIDWGARAMGYTSDLTRVLVTGKITSKLRRIYNTVLKAQLAAIAKIKPGVLASEVDAAARSIIEKAGHGKHFGHGLGHGFGLEIHENPRMAPINKAPLKAGMVVTVEPGIYLPGWGGVRIEDDILVTKDGHRVMTSVPKDLDECVVW